MKKHINYSYTANLKNIKDLKIFRFVYDFIVCNRSFLSRLDSRILCHVIQLALAPGDS